MVANVVRVLAGHNVPLTDTLIADAYHWLTASAEGQESISSEDGDRMVAAVTGVDVTVDA